MFVIKNTGLDKYIDKAPSFERFACFPQTYYLLEDDILVAILYYKIEAETLFLIDIDVFGESDLDITDALCRAAMNSALNAGAKKAAFLSEKIKSGFTFAEVSEKDLAKVFETERCKDGRSY